MKNHRRWLDRQVCYEQGNPVQYQGSTVVKSLSVALPAVPAVPGGAGGGGAMALVVSLLSKRVLNE